jgi:hypothetical protein
MTIVHNSIFFEDRQPEAKLLVLAQNMVVNVLQLNLWSPAPEP